MKTGHHLTAWEKDLMHVDIYAPLAEPELGFMRGEGLGGCSGSHSRLRGEVGTMYQHRRNAIMTIGAEIPGTTACLTRGPRCMSIPSYSLSESMYI